MEHSSFNKRSQRKKNPKNYEGTLKGFHWFCCITHFSFFLAGNLQFISFSLLCDIRFKIEHLEWNWNIFKLSLFNDEYIQVQLVIENCTIYPQAHSMNNKFTSRFCLVSVLFNSRLSFHSISTLYCIDLEFSERVASAIREWQDSAIRICNPSDLTTHGELKYLLNWLELNRVDSCNLLCRHNNNKFSIYIYCICCCHGLVLHFRSLS